MKSKTSSKKVISKSNDKIIDGVFAGLSDYFGVDATFVRIIGVLLLFARPIEMILFYIVASIIIPSKKEDAPENAKENKDGNVLFGGILIALGLVFLFKNFFEWLQWTYIWPSLIILIGIYMILRR